MMFVLNTLNKRGDAVGENLLMMYRLFVVTVIAFVVLGISAYSYSYDITVRGVEASLIARSIVLCLSDSSMTASFDLSIESQRYELLELCGISGDRSRVFARVVFFDADGSELLFLEQGDSGAAWVRDIARASEAYAIYEPGYYERAYITEITIGDVISHRMHVEVLVNANV